MSRNFKIYNTIFIIICIVMTLIMLILGIEKDLYIAEPKTESIEFGQIEEIKEISENYEIYAKKINSEEFINFRVNEYVDNLICDFKKENNADKKIRRKDKAVLVEYIDTYKVNEKIFSVKITSMAKKLYEDSYNTKIETFNFNLDNQSTIVLEDILKPQYKEKVVQIYSNKYILKSNEICFYHNNEEMSCTYNSLKEYNSSNLLNSSNYEVSQEEYDKLIGKVIDKNKKMMAITFDDGPHKTNTNEILDILSENNARATFFMLGQNVELYPDVVKDVYLRNNEIGIHTWSHPQLTKLTSDQIKKQIDNTSDAIYEITGYRPKIVRPPYGAINNTVKDAVNCPLILWNIDSLDWKSRDESKIVPLVLNNVQDGDIILLHDIHSTTIPAVEKIIKSLKEQEYQLVTVSEMLEAKEYNIKNTKIFYSGRQ